MPTLHVDIETIGRNTEEVVSLLRPQGVDLVAVTKGCLGEPGVAAAMVAGGAVALADIRDSNLRRLRTALPGVELHRIYLPPLKTAFEPGDVTYVSSVAGAAAVAAVPATGSKPDGRSDLEDTRKVMLQVETGDLREGVPYEDLLHVAAGIAAEARLRLLGVSTNYACFHGPLDGIGRSAEAVAAAARTLRQAGMGVERVSGGNSSLLALVLAGQSLPDEITELRCGEALLLGQEALNYSRIPGCDCACRLRAQVLEEYTKPARGGGPRRLVVGMGRQDLGSGTVSFVEPGLRESGRSGDYLVVEAEAATRGTWIGRTVEMIPSYDSLVAAWTSPYVQLRLS